MPAKNSPPIGPHKKRSISKSLAVSLVLSIAVISIIIASLYYFTARGREKALLESKADEYLNVIVGALEIPLWNIDRENIGNIGRYYARNDLIAGLKIMDASGRTLYFLPPADWEDADEFIRRSDRIFHQRELIGQVDLLFTQRFLKERTKELLWLSLITLISILLTVFFLTGFLLRLYLNKPLERLSNAVNSYAVGQYDSSDPEVTFVEFERFVSVLNDMGRRILTQMAELRRTEARYRDIFENAVEGIFQTTPEGQLLDVNPAMAEIFGYDSPGEMISLNAAAHNSFAIQSRKWEEFLSIFPERNKVEGFESEIRRRDGRMATISINARAVCNEAGDLVYIEGFTEDVTEGKRAREELKESEERFRRFMYHLPVLAFMKDAAGDYLYVNRCIYANPVYRELFGIVDQGRITKNDEEIFPPDSKKQIGEEDNLVINMGQSLESVQVIPIGEEVYTFLVYKFPIAKEDGPTIIGAIAMDITDRKRVEEELERHRHHLEELVAERTEEVKESEKKYRALAENPNSIVIHFDPTGVMTFVNKYAADLFGYSIEEMIGKTSVELIQDEINSDGRTSREFFDDLLKKPNKYKINENENITKDGKRLWISWSNTPTYDDQGELTGILSTGFDATERKLAEVELRESEERFRAVVENINAAIFIVKKGRYVYANQYGCRLMGLSRDDLIGRSIADFVPPEEMPFLKDRHLRRLAGEVITDIIEHKIFNADGETKWIQTNGAIISWQGEPANLAFVIDVTPTKKAQEKGARLESQLRQAQKMESLGTLAGGIAHDFNNILSVIIGYSELAMERARVDGTDTHLVEEILKAGERAKELVIQILTFSRKMEPELKPTDLNRIIEQIEKMLGRTLPKMVLIELRPAKDIWPVNADPGQITQVLMNLCTNSNDAMPEGGRLTIETRNVALDKEWSDQYADAAPGDYVQLTVYDTGQGIDKDALEHIFDPFFTQKEVGKGTGLGLAMVYGIVKNHGGFITCHSELGRGTAFKVFLPAIRLAEESKTPDKSLDKELQGGNETILLVDDEEAIRDLGETILTSQGYRVVSAETGEEALAVYKQSGAAIDLIVLDINMPGMGGRKCLKELLKLNPAVKVIISSGYSSNGQLKNVIAEGATEFIPKPFTISEILSKVRQVLDR